jgi:RNA polymerase sigma factor (sigma-70 family)
MLNHEADENSEPELVRRAKAGDLDAFEALTTRYERRVYSLALRMLRQEQDAEDVTQQTFLSALENLSHIRGEASFSTWLLRIAGHAALKVIRKRKGLDTVSLEEATEEKTTSTPSHTPNISPIGGSHPRSWRTKTRSAVSSMRPWSG